MSHADLVNELTKPGRWLCINQKVLLTLQYPMESPTFSFAFFMLKAIEYLGVGVYFFPPLQRQWSAFQEALAAHSGKPTEFIRQHDVKMVAVLKKLFLLFHPDHLSEAKKIIRYLKTGRNVTSHRFSLSRMICKHSGSELPINHNSLILKQKEKPNYYYIG